jgi:hypothetical protein
LAPTRLGTWLVEHHDHQLQLPREHDYAPGPPGKTLPRGATECPKEFRMTVRADQTENRSRSTRSTLIPGMELYLEFLEQQAALTRMVAVAGAALASSVSNALLAQTTSLASNAVGSAEPVFGTDPKGSHPSPHAAPTKTNGTVTAQAISLVPVQHSGSQRASVDDVFDELVQVLIAAEISEDLVATVRY